MSITVNNPYTGQDEQTCSVSFATQQKLAGTVESAQTEAEYHKSKMLGEWGVIAAKLKAGEIPNGTKVLTYEGKVTSGYFYVKGGILWQRYFFQGTKTDAPAYVKDAENFITKPGLKVNIPQAVAAKPKPEITIMGEDDFYPLGLKAKKLGSGTVIMETLDGLLRVVKEGFGYVVQEKTDGVWNEVAKAGFLGAATDKFPDNRWVDKTTEPKFAPAPPLPSQVAAPVPAPPVNPGSASQGSMSDEDVSALFVQTKDKLATEKGLNIKGANPALDAEVYKAIGAQIGYTATEVKAKIDAYKATGKKLSALKKKVLKGTTKTPDPKPNDVPTKATSTTVKAATETVEKVAEAKPTKVYTDEDIAAAYVMLKDAVVAGSNGKWTLYTKSDQMEDNIYKLINIQTGYGTLQAKTAIANYLASGKKLSQLKKALIKQGTLKPQADTLKKPKAEADKAKDIDAKAAAGYTPTPEPVKQSEPPIAQDKAPTKAAEETAEESGDISSIPELSQANIYSEFKSAPYMSIAASAPSIYKQVLIVQTKYPHLTALQILRVLDEYGAKKNGKLNEHRYEKKIVEWLTTPSGKMDAPFLKGEVAATAAKDKEQAKAFVAGEAAQAAQPPLPPDSSKFEVISTTQATALHREMFAERPWTPAESQGISRYTGSSYRAMNGYLRGIDPGASADIVKSSKDAVKGMRPVTRDILLHRGAGSGRGQFGITSDEQFWELTGKTLVEKGFLSTSVGGTAAFDHTKALLEVEVPRGTMGAYVKSISKNAGENEFLLAPGTRYKVLRVSKKGNQYVVRVRVVQK